MDANIIGFLNILEGCRKNKVEHLIYASSSSVYGGNKKLPFSEEDNVDNPVSLYAATKKSNELMAHSYSHLYNLPTTGLRFFTVYGPWGRPDMALFLFTKAILEKKQIKVFNHGEMERDFTYIDDIVEAILKLLKKPKESNKNNSKEVNKSIVSYAPYRILNVGNSRPVKLMNYIAAIEDELNIRARKKNMPMQPGDVEKTSSDISKIKKLINYSPKTNIKEGIKEFIAWYIKYYKK